MRFQSIVVPEVVGLPFAQAVGVGEQAGLQVSGLRPDGRGVDRDSEVEVIDQEPGAGARVRPGSRLVLRIRGSGGRGGDREPREPLPLEHSGHGIYDDRVLYGREPEPELLPAQG